MRILLLIVLCLACDDRLRNNIAKQSTAPDVAELLPRPGSYDSVASVYLKIDSIAGDPSTLAMVGPYLVLLSVHHEPFVQIVDSRSAKFVRNVGRRGQGPFEFARGPIMLPSARADSTNVLWLYDQVKKIALMIDLDRVPEHLNPFTVRTVSPSVKGLHHAVQLGDRGFLASGFDTGESFATGMYWVRFDNSGRVTSSPRVFPTGDRRISGAAWSTAYEHVLCVQPSGEKILVAYKIAGRLDILDVSTGVQSIVPTPLDFLPALEIDLSTKRPSFSQANPELRAGYVDCDVSGEVVAAAFSGKRIREFPGLLPAFFHFVHIFNWRGDLVRIIRLDHLARAMALSTYGDTLYTLGTTDDDRPAIRLVALR